MSRNEEFHGARLDVRYAGVTSARPEGNGEDAHAITAHSGGEEVGHLLIRMDGVIDSVGVLPEHQRRGVATAMWNHAQALGLSPRHSSKRTEEGHAWAKKVGGEVPPLDEEFARENPEHSALKEGRR